MLIRRLTLMTFAGLFTILSSLALVANAATQAAPALADQNNHGSYRHRDTQTYGGNRRGNNDRRNSYGYGNRGRSNNNGYGYGNRGRSNDNGYGYGNRGRSNDNGGGNHNPHNP